MKNACTHGLQTLQCHKSFVCKLRTGCSDFCAALGLDLFRGTSGDNLDHPARGSVCCIMGISSLIQSCIVLCLIRISKLIESRR